MKDKEKIKSLHENKKALFDYEVLRDYEAGIMLYGHEVKSVRKKMINLKGSYVTIRNWEAWLIGMHISPYQSVGKKVRENIDSKAERKIFLHKKDIIYLAAKLKEKGFNVVPVEIYLRGSLVKLKIVLGKSRKKFEKKQVLKERDLSREASKVIKEKYYF
ncbi:MAG: SsrA-binding protein SmpB [Candidatus Gracilibacteria bacterium]|nr:SsrA-binding protein SmpB [Candidatus Gracilibacteria bacterium]